MHAFLRIALATTLASSMLASGAQAAVDIKQFSPADCQPYGQTSTYDTLAIRADGVQNKTTNTNKYTICPIMHDKEGSWTLDSSDGLVVALVFAYAGNGTIQCTLTVGTDVAGALTTSSETLVASPLMAGLKVIIFGQAAGSDEQPATVVCRLPPLAKLSYIRSTESDADAP